MSLSKPLQAAWDRLLAAWPGSHRSLFAFGTWAVHIGTFWGLNGLLYAIHRFRLFQQYKIQPPANQPPPQLIRETIKHLAIPHFVVQPVLLYTLVWWAKRRTGLSVAGPLPGIGRVLRHLALWFVITDTLFYWSHRALHHPWLYKHIHIVHHRYTSPIGISAEYAHPIEDAIAAGFATAAGPILTNCHLSEIWLYMALRLWETIEVHSGYEFPWSPWVWLQRLGLFAGPRMHDYHHSGVVGTQKVGAYGMLRFWDWLCGTDKGYKAHLKREEEEKQQQQQQQGVKHKPHSGEPAAFLEEEEKKSSATTHSGSAHQSSQHEEEHKEEPVYTMAEVAQHTQRDDCWIVIQGGVYDVTSYLHEHPGGAAILLQEAGRDASLSFEDAAHPPFVAADMRRLRIGSVRK